MEKLFSTKVTATGAREGRVKSADGVLDMEIHMPKQGQKQAYANPETFFAAGYAACFDGALGVVLRNAGVKPTTPTSVTAEVSLCKATEGFELAVQLEIEIPGVDKQKAEEFAQQAHQVCPYSKATRNNIDVKLVVK